VPKARRQLDRHGAWVALLLCLGLVAAVYGQALTFAFTFDDPIDLPRAGGRSVWSMVSSSEGYSYYRPIPFLIWKGLRVWQGYYSQATLHGLTLLAHALSAWLLYLLLRRLTGGHWGLLAAALFITFPFSYQAVFVAVTLFHPLVTASILLALLLYYDARATGDWRRLAGSLAAGLVGLWSHESGVSLLPLLIGLELVIWQRARPRKPSWWPLLYLAITMLYVLTWLTVPKFPRQDAWTPASLLPNGQFFLEGVIYPVAAQLNAVGRSWRFDPVAALWPAIAATLLLLLLVYVAAHRPWIPLLALATSLILLAPSWLLLSWSYVVDAPRLLYPAAVGIAALWGLLPSLRWPWRPVTWVWRAGSCALLLAVIGQSVAFIGVRRDMMAAGTKVVTGVADAAASLGGRPLLFLNVPSWFTVKRPEYPVGHVGITMLPAYIGLGRSVYVERGIQPNVESRTYFPNVNGWRYDFNAHGAPASLFDFGRLVRTVAAVYTVDLLPSGPRTREVGSLQPGGAKPPAGPRFGKGVYLVAAHVDHLDNQVLGDFTWDVAAPPSGELTPVLRITGSDGTIVAVDRDYPMANVAMPQLWKAGDRVRDFPVVPLPDGLPASTYAVWLGWADHTTGKPAAGVDASGKPLPAEGVRVGQFTVGG